MNDIPCHRTDFLLDSTNIYRFRASGRLYEIDLLKKNGSANLPSSSFSKTLYTCAVEAILEYCRIVWDLFPAGERLIKTSCCSSNAVKSINSWDASLQNYECLLDGFGRYGASNPRINDLSVPPNFKYLTNGLAAELNLLALQGGEAGLPNRNVRIIIVTHLPRKADLLKEEIKATLQEYKKPIVDHLDIIVINTVPIEESQPNFPEDVQQVDLFQHDEELPFPVKFTIYSVSSGVFLASKLIYLAFGHYELASSTISGIPMKEEQNAGSSANYDVEIVHSKKAHSQFFQSSGAFEAGFDDLNPFFLSHTRNKTIYQSLILKWCTPKSSSVEINNCMGAYRITALDINNRPSSCLINFLLTGKTVNLEMNRYKNFKLMSHMLQSHNSELFIHVLSCTRSLIEDPPSISEGIGGRITDYRINEFADVMRRHRLVKMDEQAGGTSHLEQAKESIKRATTYWPLTTGLTVFFNIRELQTFYQMISKEKLTEPEVFDLKNIIYSLAGSETKGLSLPGVVSTFPNIRSKGLKKDDQYRIMWHEMELTLRAFNVTPEHQSVLQCLLDVKPKGNDAPNHIITSLNGAGSVVNQLKNGTSDAKGNGTRQFGTKINFGNISIGSESLQSLYQTKICQKNDKRRREFLGRTKNEGKIAKLYNELPEEK